MADPDPVRLTRAGGSDRQPLAMAALIALLIGTALLKPWGTGPGSTNPAVPASAPSRPAATASPDIAVTPNPIAVDATSPAAATNVSSPCYWGMAWRLFTAEASDVGPIHTWYLLQPQQASGPADPAIRVTRIHSSAVGQLGYCSVSRPGLVHIVGTQAWVLVPGGQPRPIALAPAVGTAPADPDTGVIYQPPSSTAWTSATYVFGIRLATTPSSEEWFAVQIL